MVLFQREPAGLLWEPSRWRLWALPLLEGDQAAYLQEGPTTESQKQEVWNIKGDHNNIAKRSGKRGIVRGLVGKVRDAAEDVGIVGHPLLRVGDEGEEPPSLSAAGGLWQIFLNFQPSIIFQIDLFFWEENG